MSAYVIFIRDATTDQAALDVYNASAPATAAGHAMKPLVFYGPLDVIEGAPAEGVVLLEFPTMAAARAWYDSPAYQDAAKHRHAGADYRVMIVDGVGSRA